MPLSTSTLDLYSVIFAAANESSDVQASLKADVGSFVTTAENVSEIFKLITAKLKIINDPSLSATWGSVYTEHQNLRTSYKDHSSTVVAFVNKLVTSGLPTAIDETKPDNVKLIILGGIEKGVEPLKVQSANLLISSQSVSSGLVGFSQRLDEITDVDPDQKLIDVAILAIDLSSQFHELQKKIYSLDGAIALGIVDANTTNGLFLQYLSSIFAVIYGQGRNSAIWTKFVKDLYVDKYVSQDLAFRTDLFQQGKKYSHLPTSVQGQAKKIANATKGGIDIGSKHIWDEIVKDTNELIAWIKEGSPEEATPTIATLYKEYGKKTVYDNLVNALRTVVSQG